jgi:hypothetical protein
MPTWKKVIVSGSNANLTALSVDNLTAGQVVIGGGTSNLTTTAINGTGNILGTTGATGASISGSFSGSFQGTFSGLINSASSAILAATASFITASGVFGPHGASSVLSSSFAISSSRAATATVALISSASIGTLTFGEGLNTGTYNGSSNVTLTVSGAAQLTNNAITKWDNTDGKFVVSSLTDTGTVVSGVSSIQLTGASSVLTGSFTGSFKGDGSGLTGLASTLTVSGSSGAGGTTVALGTQTLNIIGTTNQIATSASAQTVTISLPNNVTIPNNLTVTGDLTVNGTTTTVDTTNLLVEDKFILLANGSTTGTDGGIIVQNNVAGTGFAFGYDTTDDRWAFQDALSGTATTFGTITAYANTTQYGSAASKPNDATGPAYGGVAAGYGNTWVSSDTGEIWIYS